MGVYKVNLKDNPKKLNYKKVNRKVKVDLYKKKTVHDILRLVKKILFQRPLSIDYEKRIYT